MGQLILRGELPPQIQIAIINQEILGLEAYIESNLGTWLAEEAILEIEDLKEEIIDIQKEENNDY